MARLSGERKKDTEERREMHRGDSMIAVERIVRKTMFINLIIVKMPSVK